MNAMNVVFCRVFLFHRFDQNMKGVPVVLRSIDKSEGRQDKRDSQDQDEDAPVVTRWLGVTTVSPRNVPAGALPELSESRELGETRNTGSSHGKNSLTLQASIESEDRAGDVIRAEGWELDNYRLNPVILWTHRHDLLPVGKSVDVWVENGALMATVEFAPTEFAQQVRRMFEEGFLRGVSVGFRALKTSPRSGNGRRGTVFERQELLEISAAPVPMHPYALAAGRAEAALGRRASSAGHARASAAGLVDLAAGESEQRDLVPLFRELAEMWQSFAGVRPSVTGVE